MGNAVGVKEEKSAEGNSDIAGADLQSDGKVDYKNSLKSWAFAAHVTKKGKKDGAPVFCIPARTFPVETYFAKSVQEDSVMDAAKQTL
mmetsp:Transcript_2522/g.4029  ORF Transcript_2522/g.4029 Transcript_2522/m.4029 type:complete len:88 (+) Transcript_2522:1712-1975(+)